MPELPEVETIARCLDGLLSGLTVADVEVRWPRSVATPSPETFSRELAGLTVRGVSRRGKFVVIDLSTKALLVHLRMTGQLLFCEAASEELDGDPHVHVVVRFASDSGLYYRDVRKFGRLWLVEDPESVLEPLGPEPLAEAFTHDSLGALLGHRRRQVKPLLLDQHVLAGLGNIYVDESLWAAGIHPLRHASGLAPEEMRRLHSAIRAVLGQAVLNKGTTLQDFVGPQGDAGRNQDVLAVVRREGEPCLRCGQDIERIVVGGRGTHYCPACQPWSPGDEHPVADRPEPRTD